MAERATQAGAPFTRLRCARLFDGVGDDVLDNASVLIQGAKVAAVGPAAEVQAPAGAPCEEWDFAGAFVLPGLIDIHSHVTLPADGTTYERMMEASDELMALTAARNLRLHLRSGVTTLRDNGARNRVGFAVREGLRRGYITGPRLLVCGRSLTCTGGHFHFTGAVADGAEALTREVRRLVHEGADFVKIMASGGGTAGTQPGLASYTEAELRAAAEEAHRFGRTLVAHTRAKASMWNAVRAGVDLLEHAQYTDPDLVPRFDEELTDQMLRAGTWVSPTLQASTGYCTWLWLRGKRAAEGLSAEEEAAVRRLEAQRETRLAVFRRQVAAGLAGRIVAGSDAGCSRIVFGHLEHDLELMVEAGLSTREALRSATSLTAQASGIFDLVGAIQVGKEADLLVVAGDPLASIADLSRVQAVIKGGERVV